MPVIKKRMSNVMVSISVTDESGTPVAVVSEFLAHLSARECSPNTSIAYAHDLSHWWRFLAAQHLSWYGIRPVHTVEFLQFLRRVTTLRRSRRTGPRLALVNNGELCAALAPSTINRILAAVSSFYQFAILTDQYRSLNPIEKSADFATERVSERHRPAMGRASWQRPMRRRLAVRAVIRVPRPLSTQQVKSLLAALRSQRDLALVRLMLDGGLRPGEVLALKLEDISYGHRRAQISDSEVLRDYRAVLAPGATIAGRGAEAIRDGKLRPSAIDWLKCNFFKTELELGHCLRLPEEGPCECDLYLTCAKFVTTPAYVPRLRVRRQTELTLAADAKMRGWIKEEERHRATISRIDQLLDDLGEAPEEQLLATNTHICGSEAKSFHARKLKPGRETRSAAKGGRSEPAKP